MSTFNERLDRAKDCLFSCSPNTYDMMVTHSQMRNILDFLRDPEEKPKEPYWCSHIRYQKNTSEYQGDWILNDATGIFVDHRLNYGFTKWVCCPYCGAKRPKEKRT